MSLDIIQCKSLILLVGKLRPKVSALTMEEPWPEEKPRNSGCGTFPIRLMSQAPLNLNICHLIKLTVNDWERSDRENTEFLERFW